MKLSNQKPEKSCLPDSQSLSVRSLRRRLWKALQEEDVTSAVRAYTVSKDEYRKWLDEEIEEGERLQTEEEERKDSTRKERRQSRIGLRKRGSVKFESKRRIKALNRNSISAKVQKAHIFQDEEQDNDMGLGLRSGHPNPNVGSDPILQTRFRPGDEFVRDDFYGPYDSYNTDFLLPPSAKTTTKGNIQYRVRARARTIRKVPRFAGFLTPWKSASRSEDFMRSYSSNNNSQELIEKVDENMTTLMHEASRLASADFLHLLLGLGGNPNVRNGQQRTALHMVAGGTLEQELRSRTNFPHENLALSSDVGIQAPEMDPDEGKKEEKNQPRIHRKAARAMSRIFQKRQNKSEIFQPDDKNNLLQSANEPAQLKSQRMDALLAILSWVHPDDGTSATGEGPSINSVDARGRTALHYAAELGREDLSLTILTSFGAILTIVDETGRTPCELAAEQNHPELAAELEARALLYNDPWVDEDIMRNIWGGPSDDEAIYGDTKQKGTKLSARSKLAAPFSWFETWNAETVQWERQTRINILLEQMQTILSTKQEEKEAKEFMYNHGVDDSMDEIVTEFCENGVTDIKTVEQLERDIIKEVAANIEAKISRENVAQTVEEQSYETGTASSNIIENATFVKPPSEFQILSHVLQSTYAELFATFHGWDVTAALDAFRVDPVGALQEAGIETPHEQPQLNKSDSSDDKVCLICSDDFGAEADMWVNLSGCEHSFCMECLQDYVSVYARSKSGLNIVCPHHNCTVPMSPDELRKLSRNVDLYESLINDANQNFVATADVLRFCPHPGCDGVVHRCLPSSITSLKVDQNITNLVGAVCTVCTAVKDRKFDDDTPLTYEGVQDARYISTRNKEQPKRAHRFCFECGSGNMHWPVQCETLGKWKEKIVEEIGELEGENEGLEGTGKNFDDVAQRLWLKANTRPCPKCKAPIQKSDGCNHMICSNRNCRHEFCWICREDWKLHNTESGGFFRCNRWEGNDNHTFYDSKPTSEERTAESNITETHSSEASYGTSLHSSRAAWKKSKEMGLFLHHYRRWEAHSESATLERQMADTACARLAPVVEAAIVFNGHEHFNFGGKGLSFVHAAFIELLECRSLLQHSYAFAFFRYPIQYHIRKNRTAKSRVREKLGFDQLQAELETLTEQMSDIIARKHIRATQMQIMFLTNSACQKRSEINTLMLSLLDAEKKETAEENERVKKEKLTIDRTPDGTGVTFIGFQPGLQHGPHSDHPHSDLMSWRRRRLMDNESGPYDNFGEEDVDFLINNNRRRMEIEDDEVLQFLPSTIYNAEENVDRFQDWPCSDCTYMNAGGRRCAMCGNARS